MIHNLHVIERQLHESILEHLGQFPAVALLGSRQVGKTTLAELICRQRPGCIYLDLESTADRNKLVDPESYLARFEDKLVILDEVQRAEQQFDVPPRQRNDSRGASPLSGCTGSLPPGCREIQKPSAAAKASSLALSGSATNRAGSMMT